MEHYYALILAGGGGTRLWPLSRKSMPKQLLPLVGEQTMFQMSVARLAPLFPPENIFIVTGQNYVDDLRTDTPHIPAENFIVEPYPRDNAAATGLALTVIHHRDPQAVVAILTADHHIGQPARFLSVLKAAHDVAQSGYIVTLGIAPTYPATGFGYIEQDTLLGASHNFDYYKASRFTEKPEREVAIEFIATGRYSWNSGMFIWSTATALSEFERQQPEMHQHLMTLEPVVDTPEYERRLNAVWDHLPKKSIDYAIMEGANNIAVIPVEFGWNDIGSWASLYEVLPLDEAGNYVKGHNAEKHITRGAQNTLVFSDKLVVTLGVDNLIVVETPDALLICHKDHAQSIRDVVKQLQENDENTYL